MHFRHRTPLNRHRRRIKNGIVNRQIGVKNFIRVVILDPRTKGHVIQRMRNTKIAMVRYVQPKGQLMILQ